MERIFWVKDGQLDEVNTVLQNGGRVKTIVAIPDSQYNSLAYIVIEFD